jgi:hypothetical protein
LLIWSALAIVVVVGIIATEVAKRTSVHDYSSNRSSVEWPERLVLDRSDLERCLRYQFNVELDSDGSPIIRAGLCQVAGRDTIEAIDIITADATLLMAYQPWFDRFIDGEMETLDQLQGELSLDELRKRFIGDLAALEQFQRDFPGLLEEAAEKYGVEIVEGAEP